MKEPKLILAGPPDSGKTSWVAPFEGNLNLSFVPHNETQFHSVFMFSENKDLLISKFPNGILYSINYKNFFPIVT